MENGYKILWTNNALAELTDTFVYLKENFTEKELKILSKEIEHILILVSRNPHIFPISESKKIRRAIIRKYNTMYYRENGNTVEILSFFSNRQSPIKREL
jgi:plasmid stabilization system protein ParE